MRPNSRGLGGNPPGSSGGGVPGTASFRPGSGKRPPGTSRLRTGMAPTGPGTQAAQGLALNASINVSDRPMTGQGVMGMKTQSQGQGRIVQDSSYYVGLLRKKITDVTSESQRLRSEADQHARDNSQYSQLERQYESLLKQKEQLEGQLADYNLALDKTRTSTDPKDVAAITAELVQRNATNKSELDRIFMMRKNREKEAAQTEDQIAEHYRSIQARMSKLEPGKLRAYNDLLSKQKELQNSLGASESKITEINSRIRAYEADEKGHSFRKEYDTIEKQVLMARRDAKELSEELEISGLDPKEAHAKFLARVNDHKQSTKVMEERVVRLKKDIEMMKRSLEELGNSEVQDDGKEAEKFELLQKRDQDMTAFMEKFPETKSSAIAENEGVQGIIVALLEHMSRGIEDSTSMPNRETMSEMEEAKRFKSKNLETAQRTMESLEAEHRKRDKELKLLEDSEPKLKKELKSLHEAMTGMKAESKAMSDVDGLKRKFELTKSQLLQMTESYRARKQAMHHQVQLLSSELEGLKKTLATHEVAKELEETEKNLKQKEKVVFELKEKIEIKSRETDYEALKSNCQKVIDALNAAAVKFNQDGQGAYAQSKW